VLKNGNNRKIDPASDTKNENPGDGKPKISKIKITEERNERVRCGPWSALDWRYKTQRPPPSLSFALALSSPFPEEGGVGGPAIYTRVYKYKPQCVYTAHTHTHTLTNSCFPPKKIERKRKKPPREKRKNL
jgi:hypothetical protein